MEVAPPQLLSAVLLEEYDRTGEFPLDKKKRKKASTRMKVTEPPSSH